MSRWISLVMLGMLATAQAQAGTCDERCLLKTLDDYLQHLERHDTHGLKVAASLNARENAEAVPLGSGSWSTISRVLPGLKFADAMTGEAVYAGGVEHGDRLGALFLRIKVENGQISESEMLTRGGEPGGTADMSGLREPDILYDAIVPTERRSTREQLFGFVNAYLDGISKHDGSIPHFSYRCDRYSAGMKWTNNPDNPPEKGGGSCASSFTGLKGQEVVNRRFVVADPVHGIVAALFIIPHGEASPQRSTNVGEVFKIVDGKIRSIEEFGGAGKYPPASGFPDR